MSWIFLGVTLLGKGPTVDGQGVSWREDRAALRQGREAQAEDEARVRAECPHSLFGELGALGH